MLAAERGRETAGNEAVHHLHPLEMARGSHDVEERAIEWQRSLMLCEIGRARLAQQFRLLAVRSLRIGIVDSIDVFDDCEARRSERVSEQKGASVRPVRRQAGVWKLMVVVRGKGAADDRAGGGKVDRKLVRDRAVLDIGDAFRR